MNNDMFAMAFVLLLFILWIWALMPPKKIEKVTTDNLSNKQILNPKKKKFIPEKGQNKTKDILTYEDLVSLLNDLREKEIRQEEENELHKHLDHSIKKLQIEKKRLAAKLENPTFWVKDVPTIDKKNYTQSEKWDQIRKAVLKRDDYTCRKCNASGVLLDVHHLHYKNLGNESLQDLVTVCRSCHNEIHALNGYNPHYTFPLNEYDILNTHIDEDELPF